LAGSGECAFGDECFYKHDEESIAKAKDYPKTRAERSTADGSACSASPAKPKNGAVGIRLAMVSNPSCLSSGSRSRKNLRVTLDNRVGFRKIRQRGLHKSYTKAFPKITKPVKPVDAPAMTAVQAAALPASRSESETFIIERCRESGAATSLGSRKAWEAQGVPSAFLDQVVTRSSSPARFATGGSVRPAEMATTVESEISGSQQSYQMPLACPLVFSQGQPVVDQRKLYVWHPDVYEGRPFYADLAEVKLVIPEDAQLHVASRSRNIRSLL
jgi:hypothetical protein